MGCARYILTICLLPAILFGVLADGTVICIGASGHPASLCDQGCCCSEPGVAHAHGAAVPQSTGLFTPPSCRPCTDVPVFGSLVSLPRHSNGTPNQLAASVMVPAPVMAAHLHGLTLSHMIAPMPGLPPRVGPPIRTIVLLI
jgi:hypothetical protein